MSRWQAPAVERALMVGISAFLFVELFQLNGFLFEAIEHAQGINWIFLPAGFRVLLVLILDWPGAIGIALGTLWLQSHSSTTPALPMLLISMASGIAPWLVKRWLEQRNVLHPELKQINSASLLQYVLLCAAVSAISHQALFWGFSVTDSRPWIDVWPMFMGDMLGALIVLYTFKMSLSWLRSLVRPRF